MEGGGGGSSNSSSSGSGSSRWNPTKEQISMLENLYKQGIRTPSAEQIQHITARLRAYGHIEGKNVFYWFQNHKARQRQKQKQDTIAYFNRFLHHQYPPPPHHSLLLPPSPNPANVVCAPYYLPHCEMGYYPQHQRLLLPGRMPPNYDHSLQVQVQPPQQTLPLFPLHPTGILEPKPIDSASENHPPFFDFLSSSTQDLNK